MIVQSIISGLQHDTVSVKQETTLLNREVCCVCQFLSVLPV